MLYQFSGLFCLETHSVSSSQVNAEASCSRAQQKDKDVRPGGGQRGEGKGGKTERVGGGATKLFIAVH